MISNGSKSKVGYVTRPELIAAADKLPSNRERSTLVHSLIKAYGLMERMDLVRPIPATKYDLEVFHSSEYVEFLFKAETLDSLSDEYMQNIELFDLIDDCHVFPGLHSYVEWIAGASLAAAKSLVSGKHQTVLNWDGGRHHCQQDHASGFCYVNDIVLAIMEMRNRFSRILYIDIDVHHGDGVESAFIASSSVLTLSFHRHESGFFPGSGGNLDVGIGKGRYHALNVPLLSGMRGPNFVNLFRTVTQSTINVYKPDAVFMQCGVDGLSQDPLGGNWNLDTASIGHCVQIVLDADLPAILSGGGGYNSAAAACCWTHCTDLAVRKSETHSSDPNSFIHPPIAQDLPDHEYLDRYAPDYSLFSRLGNMRDLNTKEYLDTVIAKVQTHLDLQKNRVHSNLSSHK
ncbi:hypothetical protein BDV3_000052 [Batrachochytrium dendrobatidis]|uniref:Histone deacetylase n=1 Tax=Batrachochytrium dendrobatidis (strain JEL423) TaxID=403673 RepID=A0A177W834_BATDL|nr:hypothetical protein BDEG_20020 [Batrachochytrium dendrobatidis JEL423]